MDLRELVWFLKLAETQHVTDAAAELNITQPTLSRAIARLERKLGVPVFDRRQNRLRLNKYGEVLRAHAVRALAELDGAEHRIATLIDPSVGTVAVGFLHSLGGWLIPALLSGYKEVAPGATFELRGSAADVVIDELRNGRIDMGFVSPRPADPALRWTHVADEELFLLLPPGHRLARRKSVALTEVADEPFVGLTPQYGLRQVTDRLCAANGFTPTWAMVCTEVSTLRSLIESGLGVGIVPALPAESAQTHSAATQIPIRGTGAVRPVGLITIDEQLRSPAALRFVEHVAKTVAAQR